MLYSTHHCLSETVEVKISFTIDITVGSLHSVREIGIEKVRSMQLAY